MCTDKINKVCLHLHSLYEHWMDLKLKNLRNCGDSKATRVLVHCLDQSRNAQKQAFLKRKKSLKFCRRSKEPHSPLWLALCFFRGNRCTLSEQLFTLWPLLIIPENKVVWKTSAQRMQSLELAIFFRLGNKRKAPNRENLCDFDRLPITHVPWQRC